MTNYAEILRNSVFPRVQTPGQYIGGELNMTMKNPAAVRGRFCFAFPDTYSIGMSCHGFQVIYHLVNLRPDWYCERVFAPMTDMEQILRDENLPLTSLETSTPLAEFDVLGFTLQHELCYTNVLTMLDLGRVPLDTAARTPDVPLVAAGGPCVQNPEPMSRFIDAYIMGDGEESVPAMCDAWLEIKAEFKNAPRTPETRHEMLHRLATRFPWLYVPCCYSVEQGPRPRPIYPDVPEIIEQAVVENLDDFPLPVKPVVPNVEAVQDRIAIEIMRGCPWRCRFCQSNPIRRPVRTRKIETLVPAALASYENTGYNELSLLSLSTSDYPRLAELVGCLRAEFAGEDMSISVPSLRVNEKLQEVGEMLTTERHSGLTLAPEAALDDMREIIGKPITTEDLLAGCRVAFANKFQRVKLYFMMGLPGETDADIDGMVELADKIACVGKEVSGRFPAVVVSVSNFVPKPQTPLEWCAMATREELLRRQKYLRFRKLPRSISVKYHFVESSLLEGVLSRGDRRVGEAIELAWRRGARFDSWSDHFMPDRWWDAFRDAGIDVAPYIYVERTPADELPWDHIAIRQGRDYLVREYESAMAGVRNRTTFLGEL